MIESTESIQTLLSSVPGNVCPECGHRSSKVVDSRYLGGGSIRRRRRCYSCQSRFTTYEIRVDSLKDFMDLSRSNADAMALKVIVGMARTFLSKPMADKLVDFIKIIYV